MKKYTGSLNQKKNTDCKLVYIIRRHRETNQEITGFKYRKITANHGGIHRNTGEWKYVAMKSKNLTRTQPIYLYVCAIWYAFN